MNLNVDTDAVLLIDAENKFNSVNRKVVLHNLKFICPIIVIYIINCCATPQGYLLSVGERYSLVRGQLMMTQQLWEDMH